MNAFQEASLDVVYRRLSHIKATANLLAEADDTRMGQALFCIAAMLSDTSDIVEKVLDEARAGKSGES